MIGSRQREEAYHYSKMKPVVDPGHEDRSILQLAAVEGCLDLVKYVMEVTGLELSEDRFWKNAFQLVSGLDSEPVMIF